MSEENETTFEDEFTSEIRSSTDSNSVRENEENITVIWFNPVEETTDDIERIKQNLQAANDVVLYHNRIDPCIADMKCRKTEKILLIITAESAKRFLSDISGFSQLDSIFIFTEKQEEFNQLRNGCSKIVGVFDNVNNLIESIEQTITQNSQKLKILPFHDQYQRGARNLSEQSAEFLWFESFKAIIQGMDHDDTAKQEMLTACRGYYQNNDVKLKTIHNFEQNYRVDLAIRWYTKDTFVYELVNKALRTEDLEQLFIFRYYIAHLSKQLAERYEVMKGGSKHEFSLYRGTQMSKAEAEKIKANVGQLIFVNSYWSTSTDRACACRFANKYNDRPDIVPVLFEIQCDLHECNDSVIFADISDLSEFNTENETLFDAGSIFKIGDLREDAMDDTKLYVIEIRASGEGKEIAKTYVEEIKGEMRYESPRIMLGVLLKRIGKYERSLEYFKELLKNPGEEKLAHIHNRIGIALRLANRHNDALEHFNKAYDSTLESNPAERIYLAFIRHNQGQVHATKKNFPLALQYYQDAVNIVKQEIGENNRYVADYYSCIGRVYSFQKDYKTAMYYLQKALEIRKACLPPDHVIHAFSYIDIAKIFAYQNNYHEALRCHRIALELRQKYLLPNHLNTAHSLYYVGKMHHQLGRFKTALKYYQEALEMKRKCLPDSEPFIVPNILQDIAMIYDADPETALKYRLEALDIIERNVPHKNYSSLVRLFENIASTYQSMHRMENALDFYQRALEIREHYLCKDKSNWVCLLDAIAAIHKSMNRMNNSLNFYLKALEIRENSLDDDLYSLARLHDDVAFVYRSMGKRYDAIHFYQKALRIRRQYLSNNDFNLSHSYNHLASLYEEIGNMASALRHYQQLSEIYQYHDYYGDARFERTRRSIQRVQRHLGIRHI